MSASRGEATFLGVVLCMVNAKILICSLGLALDIGVVTMLVNAAVQLVIVEASRYNALYGRIWKSLFC